MTVLDPADIERRRLSYWKRIDDGIFDRWTTDTLMPFQRDGVDWLGRHKRSILADDMGLGKTVQALAAIAGSESYPCLLICKASLLPSMANQIRRWTGEEPYIMDRGNRRACIRAQKTLPRKFLIAHYEGVVKEAEELREFEWASVIVDEATMIKNRSAQRTRAVKSLRAPTIYLLSGTPLMNSPMDLWSLLNMLDSKQWSNYYKFEKRHCILGGWQNRQVIAYRNMPELKTYVRTRMMRRRKDEVLKDLPAKTRIDLMIDLPKWQREIYDRALTEMLVEINSSKTLDIASVLARMTRLKQIAVWPQATLHVDRKEMPGKIEALLDLLEERAEAGQKTLVFSKYVTVINALDKLLLAKLPKLHAGDRYGKRFMFTGAHKDAEEDFQNHVGPAVWMSTIDAGNMGLTLTSADMVVFTDKDWVPAMNEQAEDRAHRIGQKDNVSVVSLIARETIEERIEVVLAKKKDMFNTLIEHDGGVVVNKITLEDVKEILR